MEVFAISLPRSSNSLLGLRKVCGNVSRSSMRPDRAPIDTSEGLSCLTCSDEGAARPLVDKFDKANLTRACEHGPSSPEHTRETGCWFADWTQQDIEMASAVRTKLAESWLSNPTK